MSNAPEVMSPYFHNPKRYDMPRIISPYISQMQKDIAEIKEYIQSKEKDNSIRANTSEIPVWEHGVYRSVHHTLETYVDGSALICPFCRNAFKEKYVDPRWNFCPHCGKEVRKEDHGQSGKET